MLHNSLYGYIYIILLEKVYHIEYNNLRFRKGVAIYGYCYGFRKLQNKDIY